MPLLHIPKSLHLNRFCWNNVTNILFQYTQAWKNFISRKQQFELPDKIRKIQCELVLRHFVQ